VVKPGGNVPQSPSNPVAFKLPSSPTGVGASLSYNFTNIGPLEGDYGGNWKDPIGEHTGKHRTEVDLSRVNINVFVHTLISVNRLTVNGLDPSNGVGGISVAAWI